MPRRRSDTVRANRLFPNRQTLTVAGIKQEINFMKTQGNPDKNENTDNSGGNSKLPIGFITTSLGNSLKQQGDINNLLGGAFNIIGEAIQKNGQIREELATTQGVLTVFLDRTVSPDFIQIGDRARAEVSYEMIGLCFQNKLNLGNDSQETRATEAHRIFNGLNPLLKEKFEEAIQNGVSEDDKEIATRITPQMALDAYQEDYEVGDYLTIEVNNSWIEIDSEDVQVVLEYALAVIMAGNFEPVAQSQRAAVA